MFIHPKVTGRVKMRHAQHELNQARLEMAPLTSFLRLAFLYQRFLTSDLCPPPPSPSSSNKSYNPSSSMTPPFCSGVGVHVCTPTREISRPALPAVLGGGGGEDVAFSVALMVESISNIKIGHWIELLQVMATLNHPGLCLKAQKK